MTDDVTPRFAAAIAALRDAGHPVLGIAGRTGIDRRNLMRLVNDTSGRYSVPAPWLAALCREFPVSPAFLLTGEGAPLLHHD